MSDRPLGHRKSDLRDTLIEAMRESLLIVEEDEAARPGP